LADLDETNTPERADDVCSAENRERRAHAESWNVVTMGFSNDTEPS
jgi:hypothetical protein